SASLSTRTNGFMGWNERKSILWRSNMKKEKLFINGQWVEAKNYEDLLSPYNREVIARIPLADKEEVEEAIVSAQKATSVMRQLTALERSEILEKVSSLLKERQEKCAKILSLETTKPIKAARAEIQRTIETYKFATEEAKEIVGE